jgi:hypothetical protein
VTVFNPGDRVRRLNEYKEWTQATVVAVGKQRLLVEYEWTDDVDLFVQTSESCWTIAGTELVPVYPELWINVYRRGTSVGYGSRTVADAVVPIDADDLRTGVIHLASDGTLTLEPVAVSGDVRGAA